jgi:hypothetical protein
MRARIYTPKKIVSGNASGEVVRHTAPKIPTQVRIKQLINELGLDEAEYLFKASIRKYTKQFELGLINL